MPKFFVDGSSGDVNLGYEDTGTTAELTWDASEKKLTSNGVDVYRGAGNVSTNTAVGASALASNTTGFDSVAIGHQALDAQTTGQKNVAIGPDALGSLQTGDRNTAIGHNAASVCTASNNTAVGDNALASTTTGQYNVVVGNSALDSNTTASNNTAVGYQAGYSNTTGIRHTIVGNTAGYSLTTATRNTFIGDEAGYYVTTGEKNTIIGRYTGNQGGLDIRTSSNYIVLSDGDGHPAIHYEGDTYGTLYINAGNVAGGNWAQHIKNLAASANYGLYIQYPNSSPNSTGSEFLYAADSTESKFIVSSNGNVSSRTNSYGGISDITLKENIIEASSQWDDIKAVQVKKYSFISENSKAPTQLGVIAQDLESAGMSGLVAETPDKDNEGNLTGTTTKTVKYSILYMKAVKALQEAMERIETLEAKVAALESN